MYDTFLETSWKEDYNATLKYYNEPPTSLGAPLIPLIHLLFKQNLAGLLTTMHDTFLESSWIEAYNTTIKENAEPPYSLFPFSPLGTPYFK